MRSQLSSQRRRLGISQRGDFCIRFLVKHQNPTDVVLWKIEGTSPFESHHITEQLHSWLGVCADQAETSPIPDGYAGKCRTR